MSKNIIEKKARKYFSEDFKPESWEIVQEQWNNIINTPLNSVEELEEMVEKFSEFNAILSQIEAWLYIRMTCQSDNPENEEKFNKFYSEIIGPSQDYEFQFKEKFYSSPFRKELDAIRYAHLNKLISNEMEIFRKENIPLFTKESELANKYGAINGKMSVIYNGEEKTMQQLNIFLKNKDRSIREDVWRLKMNRMVQEKDILNNLFTELLNVRVDESRNAGFENYRDFNHKKKGRFDYTPEDLYSFHAAVEKVVIPFIKEINETRRIALNIDSVRPWDTAVDTDGKILKPFLTTADFIEKSIKVLNQVDPEFGEVLLKMKNTELLDLENRKGKSPGGYNYPLEEMGSSFIFMNSIGLHSDVVTLLHEVGHAMHSYYSVKEPISHYRALPSEVAELASMSMEFLTMEYWDEYYKDPEDLKKAKRDQLEGALKFLPWCMIVDAFQHWIYLHPDHTIEERYEQYLQLVDRFANGVDWKDLEELKKIGWLFQLHIFEVPFYYIEYGMSQLGALAVYKNYKENGQIAIGQYKDFLKLSYSKPLTELFKTAGIEFSFNEKYIKGLVSFVKEELKKL